MAGNARAGTRSVETVGFSFYHKLEVRYSLYWTISRVNNTRCVGKEDQIGKVRRRIRKNKNLKLKKLSNVK